MDSTEFEQGGASASPGYDAELPPSYSEATEQGYNDPSQGEIDENISSQSDQAIANTDPGLETHRPPPCNVQKSQGGPSNGNTSPPQPDGLNQRPIGYRYQVRLGLNPQPSRGSNRSDRYTPSPSNVVVVNQPMENQAFIYPPADHMTGAILVCVLCCIPIGIMAIIKADEARDHAKCGNYYRANKAANWAKRLIKIGIVVGTIFTLIYVTLIAFVIVIFSISWEF